MTRTQSKNEATTTIKFLILYYFSFFVLPVNNIHSGGEGEVQAPVNDSGPSGDAVTKPRDMKPRSNRPPPSRRNEPKMKEAGLVNGTTA